VPSRLSFDIEGAGPGVRWLTVVHETEPRQGSQIAEVAAGRAYAIAGLKTLLETREPMASHARAVARHARSALALVGPGERSPTLRTPVAGA
jgi:hypothetical protein